ncbi:MAG: cytochrome c oxidase assembly protein [Agarilytica sp.]
MADEQKQIHITIAKLCGLAVSMFVFAMWVMPPLYIWFCDVAGLNGKTRGQYEAAVPAAVDTSRTVTVQFVAMNNENMPWEFSPNEFSVKVHPGEAKVTHFDARNLTGEIMVAQAVPSMVPSNATDYFHKTECFCFNKQVLGPNENAELGLQFIVDQALPKNVKTITLSYSLFDVTEMSQSDVENKAAELQAQNSNTNESLKLTAN